MIQISASLGNLDQLRQFILPPSMICVSPKKITATWFLQHDISNDKANLLLDQMGFVRGEGNGARVAFHPKVAYAEADLFAASQVDRATLFCAMSGPSKNYEGRALTDKSLLLPKLPEISDTATRAALSLVTIAYPSGWLNEPLTVTMFCEHLYRATRETPGAFIWMERDGVLMINVRTAARWWNNRYRLQTTEPKAAEMLRQSGWEADRCYIDGRSLLCYCKRMSEIVKSC